MKNPLVSCVCVTYNRPKLLNELLFSFINQDYDNKELIIVNDQVDIKYVYDGTNVRIYNLNQRFSSLGKKRNFAKRLINGDYMFTMDDDDIYYSTHISDLVKFHMENPEYDIVTNQRVYYSESNKKVKESYYQVPFNGACIKSKYVKNNEFPNDKSCGEDQDFVKYADVGYFKGEPTFHYRWGLNIHHMSGMGSDGKESYQIITDNTPIGETKIIELKPKIPQEVLEFYK